MKKKFRFKLEAVEKVRKAKEQETLRILALAQIKYQETLKHKEWLIKETESALDRRDTLPSTSQPVLAYQIETEFINGNKIRILQADHAILRARKIVEKALKEVLNAKRALKALEILREKAFNEFKIEVRKKEQKELEEIYVFRGFNASEEDEWSEIA